MNCPHGGKKIFESENAAKHARNKIGRVSKNMRVYKCQNCHGWHLTSSEYMD